MRLAVPDLAAGHRRDDIGQASSSESSHFQYATWEADCARANSITCIPYSLRILSHCPAILRYAQMPSPASRQELLVSKIDDEMGVSVARRQAAQDGLDIADKVRTIKIFELQTQAYAATIASPCR